MCRFVLLEGHLDEVADEDDDRKKRKSRKGRESLSDQFDLILCNEEVWQKWNQIWQHWQKGLLKDSNGELPQKPQSFQVLPQL